MSTPGAIVNLGAQLVVFISAAGLFLVVSTTPQFLGASKRARLLVQIATVMLALSAVTRGTSFDVDSAPGWLTALRAVAAVLLLVVRVGGVAHRGARLGLGAAAVLFLAGAVAGASDATTTSNVCAGAGGLVVGFTAALAARRSIAVRIAASSTALLLVIVLVLSGLLSVVLSGNISDEALRRAEDRASFQAEVVARSANDAAGQAGVVATSLQGSEPFRQAIRTDNYDALSAAVTQFLSLYPLVDFIAYVDQTSRARVAVPPEATPVVELAGSQVVVDGLAGNAAASVDVLGDGLVALGAIPVTVPDERGAPQFVGAAVTGVHIDRDLLEELLQNERDTTLAVLTRDRVLATTQAETPASVRDAVGGRLAPSIDAVVLRRGEPVSAETSVRGADAFVAVAPVKTSDGRPVAAFVVSISAALVDDTLFSLFRTLFLVALAATGGAFVLATVVGARVAAPLRRLTTAAERIASGDLSARVQIDADDEIGTLGGSFDTMTASIERMTREIREAAAQTGAILGGMAEGLVAATPDGTVVALNTAAERMLGVKEGRALGKPVEVVVKGVDERGRPLADRLAQPLAKPWAIHGRVARRRGTLAVAMSGAPIRDERGTLVGRVYVMRDIQREAELEAMKSEFLANISHELRTPLTPIKGYTEMMLAKEVPKQRQRIFLTTILESAERLERYVDMLVNFSAMEAGRFELQTSEVDVGDIATRVGDRWRAKSRGHRITVRVASRVPRVIGDERLLERSVDELVDNAVKYSPDGGPVEISVRLRGSGTARRIEVSVEDGGIGIEGADLDAIFSDFAQLDGSSTRRFGGLGLGLSFVHRVIEAHQGTLEATSTAGEGSVFTIALPPMVERPGRRRPPKGPPAGKAKPSTAKREGRARVPRARERRARR